MIFRFAISDRKKYVSLINRAYGVKYLKMDEYKHEHNIKRCLAELDLRNVVSAVNRANRIMNTLNENVKNPREYKKYTYYLQNPSLEVHTIIKEILCVCGLMDE